MLHNKSLQYQGIKPQNDNDSVNYVMTVLVITLPKVKNADDIYVDFNLWNISYIT